ncbi:hypothetical protein [Isoptericola croceus]|uniref:hypothetical protein n=1 Tax=Isoptericola croceus TaxID=3031406 RepID=UPI0023F880CF|nr:hypothetical protein [Isoptericola croceus]
MSAVMCLDRDAGTPPVPLGIFPGGPVRVRRRFGRLRLEPVNVPQRGRHRTVTVAVELRTVSVADSRDDDAQIVVEVAENLDLTELGEPDMPEVTRLWLGGELHLFDAEQAWKLEHVGVTGNRRALVLRLLGSGTPLRDYAAAREEYLRRHQAAEEYRHASDQRREHIESLRRRAMDLLGDDFALWVVNDGRQAEIAPETLAWLMDAAGIPETTGDPR